MSVAQLIKLTRPVQVTAIPSGEQGMLPPDAEVRITQSLGGAYTVMTNHGYMYRVDAKDSDALGITPDPNKEKAAQPTAPAGEFSEQNVWQQLKTVFDPEIPVNIVDLGLVYGCDITSLEDGKKIDVKMTMTAPGCGMGNVLKADVESKLSGLPGVKQVQVEVVFDPPWTPVRMSEAARLQLGIDVDYGPSDSSTAAYK